MAARSIGSNSSASTATPSAEPAAVPAEKPARPDTAALDVEALATAILAREVRPRVSDIRRLAEAVLRKKQKKQKKKNAKKPPIQGGVSERKLSRIPARKSKK